MFHSPGVGEGAGSGLDSYCFLPCRIEWAAVESMTSCFVLIAHFPQVRTSRISVIHSVISESTLALSSRCTIRMLVSVLTNTVTW